MEPLAGSIGSPLMSTAEPYTDTKAKESTTKQATEAINIYKSQSKMAGFGKHYIVWLWNTDFLFLQIVFLVQNLRGLSISQGLKLGQCKETKKPLTCSIKCLETRSYPQKNLKPVPSDAAFPLYQEKGSFYSPGWPIRRRGVANCRFTSIMGSSKGVLSQNKF